MLFARGSFRSGLRTVGHDGHPCCGASAGPFNRAPRPLALKYIDADFLWRPCPPSRCVPWRIRCGAPRVLPSPCRWLSGPEWAVAERAQLNVLGRELVPQRRGLVGEFLHDGIVLRFLFLRERLVNAVLIRPLLSPVAVVTVVGAASACPAIPPTARKAARATAIEALLRLIEVLLKGVLFVTLAWTIATPVPNMLTIRFSM